jgi:hypothetical protein
MLEQSTKDMVDRHFGTNLELIHEKRSQHLVIAPSFDPGTITRPNSAKISPQVNFSQVFGEASPLAVDIASTNLALTRLVTIKRHAATITTA